MTNFEVIGRPGLKLSSIAAWERALKFIRTEFEYIGPYDQAVIVPVGQSSIVIDAYGASSGNDSALSGRGAFAKLDISGLTGGTMLIARVAGMGGANGAGGWPGGGIAAQGYIGRAGEGGGGVTLLLKPPYSMPADVIIAIPGGGGSCFASTAGAPATARGGDGAMDFADDGQIANGWTTSGDPKGKGATYTTNGPASGEGGGTAGIDYQGGNGASTNVLGIGGSGAGGGGAGGKSGGGGGASYVISNGHAAGGGGGAGYVNTAAGAALRTATKGARLGNGQLVLIAPPSLFPPTTSSITLAYTGSQQTWVVPSGVTSIVVELRGARGGGGVGGKGLYLRFRMPVTPGETLYGFVGGQGATFNGGGSCRWTGIGGGATDIRRGGNAVSNRVAVASGGGGVGSGFSGQIPGGDAGFLTGLGAYSVNNSTQGTRSTWTANGSAMGSPGVNEQGGAGGFSGYSVAFDGGGGGGGYKAGSGGQEAGSGNTGGGGGGGTGWISSVCTELEYSEGNVVGNGSCVIRW